MYRVLYFIVTRLLENKKEFLSENNTSSAIVNQTGCKKNEVGQPYFSYNQFDFRCFIRCVAQLYYCCLISASAYSKENVGVCWQWRFKMLF